MFSKLNSTQHSWKLNLQIIFDKNRKEYSLQVTACSKLTCNLIKTKIANQTSSTINNHWDRIENEWFLQNVFFIPSQCTSKFFPVYQCSFLLVMIIYHSSYSIYWFLITCATHHHPINGNRFQYKVTKYLKHFIKSN